MKEIEINIEKEIVIDVAVYKNNQKLSQKSKISKNHVKNQLNSKNRRFQAPAACITPSFTL